MNQNTLGICLLALTLGWAGSPASAQGPKPDKSGKESAARPKGPGPDQAAPKDILERLTKALELNAAQQAKVKAILDKAKPELDKIEADMKAVHERMRTAMFQNKESIRETLTMEQKEKFDAVAMRMLMRHRMQKTIKVRYHTGRPDMMREHGMAGGGAGMMCGQEGCGLDEEGPGLGGRQERKIIEINERSGPDAEDD
ncbi:MAG: periplasmic heavy metal sensor [Elusimicrobiota bacterium]|jgi:hypothetical protein